MFLLLYHSKNVFTRCNARVFFYSPIQIRGTGKLRKKNKYIRIQLNMQGNQSNNNNREKIGTQLISHLSHQFVYRWRPRRVHRLYRRRTPGRDIPVETRVTTMTRRAVVGSSHQRGLWKKVKRKQRERIRSIYGRGLK